ncbi:MAG: UDP-N-acetylmuramate dehydrogenase [Rikenellaceae bacterium]|nr:UDP-N-acetylmuramate dehydrogenase [Rikenellaceae bacterium]
MKNRIVTDKSLLDMNTFGISARTAYYAEFSSVYELRAVLADPQVAGLPRRVVGGGSNILLQGDFPGLILHPAAQEISLLEKTGDTVVIRAEAGVEWDLFVAWNVARGYAGLENLSLIPGYVGASVIQNIGAYGVEACEAVREVEIFRTDTGLTETIPAEKCRFGYRDSIFKRELFGKAIVLSVMFVLSTVPRFRLDYGDLRAEVERRGGATIENVRQAVIAIRESKLPDPKVLGNSGSFFKNPVVSEAMSAELTAKYPDMPAYPVPDGVKLAAGWLIDHAGWKGRRMGNAGVHDRQALVLVNSGGATGAEILALARAIQDDIHEKFGVDIEPEVNIL